MIDQCPGAGSLYRNLISGKRHSVDVCVEGIVRDTTRPKVQSMQRRGIRMTEASPDVKVVNSQFESLRHTRLYPRQSVLQRKLDDSHIKALQDCQARLANRLLGRIMNQIIACRRTETL